ncbi:MAG TPA: PAS domain-containing protein [Terriglobales bacterium]|nr:PAS domain-containing protein [Terriglobales bacterium]
MTPSQESKHKGSILVIDDELANLKLLFTILTEHGYSVHPADDSRLGLQFVKQSLPDMVLVEVRMPGMDGYQVCASLKNDPTTRAIPVIFISSIDSSINQAKALLSGAVDYVTKPFDAEEVLWRIETYISLRRLREDLEVASGERTAQPVTTSEELGRALHEIHVLTRITGRKHAEEKIREQEAELRQVLDLAPQHIVILGPDGSRLYCNQATLNYYGLTLEKWRSCDPRGFFHPDDCERMANELQIKILGESPHEVDARLLRKDGTYHWFLCRFNPRRDGQGQIIRWYFAATDIEDRKQTEDRLHCENLALLRSEEELRRSEAFLAEGQRLSLTGSFSWKVATDQITWSEQLYRIFEFEPCTRVTIERINSRVHPEDLPMMNERIERARAGGADFEYAHRLLMPDGSVKYVNAIAHASRDAEGRLEYIGAVQDVTQRRISEEALAKARSELAKVARVTSLGVLTASIAHEVNQPLSGIITNASTCLRMLSADPPNVDGARETARRTIRDGNRASDVITRLRTLYIKKDPQPELMDLNEAAREVASLSLSELQRNRVILRRELADDLPPVTADRIQLQQVILNLLRNASEAMSTVDDHPRELLIRTERDEGDQVRLSVKDAGVGFTPQATDKLFEAFYTTKNDGMGIGLSISRSIIEAHRGRLWATPNDGPGATFSFAIPCRLKGLAGAETRVNRTDPATNAA